ncbi:MAG TPA: cytochrome c3 family protein [Bryobacteraceae bacterium]|nr:cytochrome c3 family protein [Bryobacteraceae bacterium]
MPGRIWNTKKLAQRIDPHYFKYPRGIAKLSLWGSIALTATGLLWLAGHSIAGTATPYTAGPIVSSHANFSKNCATCHVANASFGGKVSDQTCDACHNGPIHQVNQVLPAPACVSCHVEHRGIIDLTRTNDRYCTTCHANLQSRDGIVKVSAHINSFTNGHPNFEALALGKIDPGTIKFNHAVHLKKDLRAGANDYVNLECSDCHRPNGSVQSWPYGRTVADVQLAPVPAPHSRSSTKAYMAPVNYYEHCLNCHGLQFDERFAEGVPHVKPELVHAFVVQKFTDYIAHHPEELRTRTPDERISGRPSMPPPRTASAWIAQHTADAEYLLWNKTCKQCHSISYNPGSSLPVIAKPQITTRWLMKGNFDHQAHLEVKCESCHSQTRSSRLTSDVLIPGVESCQKCHVPSEKAAAPGGCYECHGYHDWTKEKPVKGKYDIHQLMVSVLMKPSAAR